MKTSIFHSDSPKDKLVQAWQAGPTKVKLGFQDWTDGEADVPWQEVETG